MPETPQQKIEKLAAEFVERLREIAREAVIEAVGGESSGRRSSRAVRSGTTNGDGRGAKRSPAALEALKDDFLTAVKTSPGRRIEELAPDLGVDTKQLALPVKKLISEKSVRTTGTRRATRYFPAGGANGGRSAKKAKKGKRTKR